jgi:hypothetical protein
MNRSIRPSFFSRASLALEESLLFNSISPSTIFDYNFLPRAETIKSDDDSLSLSDSGGDLDIF